MWTVVLTGTFGVLALLVKAAVDSGRKQTRWRRELTLDVELLGKLREAHPKSTSVWDLEQRIDRLLVQYSWLGDTQPKMTPAQEAEAVARQRKLRISQTGSGAVAIGAAVVAGMLLNWAVGQLGSNSLRLDEILAITALPAGVASALAGYALSDKILRPAWVMTFRDGRQPREAVHPKPPGSPDE